MVSPLCIAISLSFLRASELTRILTVACFFLIYISYQDATYSAMRLYPQVIFDLLIPSGVLLL